MTDSLTWDDLCESDIEDVRALRCSEGSLRDANGELARPLHELEVEVALQEQLCWPLARDEGALVARDTDGSIAAVSWWYVDASAKGAKLLVMAIDSRWRKKRLGDELLRQTLDRIIEHADSHGVGVLVVRGGVRIANEDSRRLMSRNQFWEFGGDGLLSEWYLRIDLPGNVDE